MSNVKQITSADFDEMLKEEGFIVIDLFAEWCPPCKMMAPIFDGLSKDADLATAKFVKVNVDEDPALGAKFNVMSIPTFVIVKSNGNGTFEEVKKVIGGQDPLSFKATIQQAIS